MASVEKDILLKVKTDTTEAQGQFKSLKQELRSIENQLIQMAESGDTGSVAFKTLQKRAGEVKDQIGDTKAAIKALSSDTFKLDAFTQAAQGIAGGFAAAQGAMSLFGTENAAVEEAIKKTQGAMALLQGVTAITNILQKETAFSAFFLGRAQQANSIATEGAAVATKGFSKALIATGIGAIVVAVGTLIAYWDDLKESIGLTNDKLDSTKKAVESVGESFGKERAEVEQLTYEFNQHNTSAKRKQEIIGELQKISPNYFGTLNKEKTKVEDLTKAQNKFNTALQKQALLKGFQKQLEELGNEQAKLNVQIETGTAEAGFFTKHFVAMKNIFTEDIFNPEAIAKKIQKAGAEGAEARIKQIEKQIGVVNSLIKKTETEIDQMGGEAIVEAPKPVQKRVKSKKELAEEAAKEKRELEDKERKLSLEADKRYLDEYMASQRFTDEQKIKKAEELYLALSISEKDYNDALKKIEEEKQKRLNKSYDDAEKTNDAYFDHLINNAKSNGQDTATLELQKLEKLLQIQKEYGKNTVAIEDQIALKKKEINEKSLEEQKKQLEISRVDYSQTYDQINTLLNDAKTKGIITQKEYNDAIKQLDDAQLQGKKAFTKAIGDLFGALSETLGKETKAGKALATAQALINTYLGISEVLRAKNPYPEPFGTAVKVASAATIALNGFNTVRNINKVQVPGGGGGSVPAMQNVSMAPSGGATQTSGLDSTQLQLDAQGNLLQQRSVRTYVLETDISSKQQRSRRLQQTSTLGK